MCISITLGYDFNKVQLKRGCYYPQGHADDNIARATIRDGLVRIVTGAQPLPMAVMSFPFSEEAIKDQQLVQQALLKTLAGDTPLRIKAER